MLREAAGLGDFQFRVVYALCMGVTSKCRHCVVVGCKILRPGLQTLFREARLGDEQVETKQTDLGGASHHFTPMLLLLPAFAQARWMAGAVATVESPRRSSAIFCR